MSLCASQAFTSVVAKSSAGYASNLSGKPQSRLPPSLYCHPFSPPVKLHRCLSPLIPSISKHRRWNQGSLCGGGIQCSAQEEGGDFGGEAAPQEGWERDAAAARVAELAQKAGAAGAGRRKLSFKAVTAAAEGSKKGEDGGSEVAPEARDVGVRKRPVIREVPFAGGRSEVADGGFDEEPPRRDDELSKRLVPRPRMEDGARFGGGLQRRQEQAPNGGTGLGDQKGPWVRKGASKGESVRSGDDDFFRGEDNVTEARSREGYRDRQTDEFAEEGSYRGGFEESGDRSNRNFNRERNVGRYEDQDSFEGGRESRRSFQGGAKGARNRGWEEGTNDFYRGENDYGPESGRNVWRRETGVVENGGEFRPPAPKPVWRNREGGEEVLGTKAWVARQRAEAEGGIGGRGAPDDWTERPPRNGRGRGGDPRGASYRRERMGVRAWNEQDDAFESERGDAPSKGQRRRGGDFSDGLESESWGGESKNDEEGAGEISSWGPRGNTKKVGVRGSGSVGGRGSFSRGGRRSEETGAGFSRTFNAPGGPRSGERFRRSEREDQFSARDEWSPRESAQKRSDTQRGSRSPSEPSQSPSELSRGPSESDRDFARGPFDSARRSASANNGADSTFVRARSNGARGFGYEDFSAPDDVGKTSLSAEEKKERQRMKRVKLEGPGCYGCGARLQVSHPGGPGYLRPDVYELVRRSFIN